MLIRIDIVEAILRLNLSKATGGIILLYISALYLNEVIPISLSYCLLVLGKIPQGYVVLNSTRPAIGQSNALS